MKNNEGIERRFHASLRLPIIGVVVVAGILAAATAGIWDRHREAIDRSCREMGNLGVVLAAQSARSLQAVDLVMQEAQGLVRNAGIATPDQFRDFLANEGVHKFLADHLRSLPQADAVSLIDDTGRIVNFSRVWPVPRIETADRDFYAHFRDSRGDRGIFIGQPVINKFTGAWVITLTRRIEASDGTFLGIVLGVVEVRYFEEFYRTIAINSGELVALFRRDGTVLVRYPRRDGVIGHRLPADAPWFGYAEKGGTYRTPGGLDGVPRIVSLHPVGEFPLVAAVAIEETSILADWRRQSTWILLGALAAAIGFALLFRALSAQSHRLERQAADLKAAAAALGNSEARFRDFALTSSDWLWETDTAHRFTYHSDNIRNFGQNPKNRLGRTRMELAADAASEGGKWEEHRAVLDRHEPFRDFVYKRQVGDDPEAYISVSGKPIFDKDGNFAGYRGTVRDITREVANERSLRSAKSAAEAANMAKSQFLANMSHELRTPLNAILGFSEMLHEGIAGTLLPQQQEYSGLIHESGRHLLNVINEILDLARVDAGKLELHEETQIDPRQIVDSCICRGECTLEPADALPVDRIRGPGAGPDRRSDTADPNPAQPAVERGQIHAARGHDFGGAAAAPGRWRRVRGARYRAWHDRRRGRDRARAVRPDRLGAFAPARRHRARPAAGSPARRAARRQAGRAQRERPGNDGYSDPAGEPRALCPYCGPATYTSIIIQILYVYEYRT